MAQNAKVGKRFTKSGNKMYPTLVDKTVSQTRQDIAKWKAALNNAKNVDNPKRFDLYNLYDVILDDTTLSSQIQNRKLDTLGATFNLKKKGGDIDTELTQSIQNTEWMNNIIEAILDTRYHGHSLIELDFKPDVDGNDVLFSELIPRQNVIPKQGLFFPDYTEDKFLKYREQPEYGTWLLEFGQNTDIGLLNKAVPHVLFKKFGQSCWSELCEIYGIPPRVYKTDTQDPQAVARGKQMMTDMGSAAWFIIDSTEEFEWAKGVTTNGDVYQNLLNFCDMQNSILISGAVLGQDTKNGSYGKEEAGQKLLDKLVLADMALVEMYMNSRVIPALVKIGIVPQDYIFEWEIDEDLDALWKKTVDSSNMGFEIDPDWLKSKFKVEIIGKKKEPEQQNKLNFNFGGDFFD